jgi:hypothetical protein
LKFQNAENIRRKFGRHISSEKEDRSLLQSYIQDKEHLKLAARQKRNPVDQIDKAVTSKRVCITDGPVTGMRFRGIAKPTELNDIDAPPSMVSENKHAIVAVLVALVARFSIKA